jgi:hypothetical protein
MDVEDTCDSAEPSQSLAALACVHACFPHMNTRAGIIHVLVREALMVTENVRHGSMLACTFGCMRAPTYRYCESCM